MSNVVREQYAKQTNTHEHAPSVQSHRSRKAQDSQCRTLHGSARRPYYTELDTLPNCGRAIALEAKAPILAPTCVLVMTRTNHYHEDGPGTALIRGTVRYTAGCSSEAIPKVVRAEAKPGVFGGKLERFQWKRAWRRTTSYGPLFRCTMRVEVRSAMRTCISFKSQKLENTPIQQRFIPDLNHLNQV
jgi:hypothetical protein